MSLLGKRRATALGIVLAVVGAQAAGAACASPYAASAEPGDRPPSLGSTDASTPDVGATSSDGTAGDAGPPLPECVAQRTVHLVAGTGGLAWFTLLWPLPTLIADPQPADAYDDPSKAALVATSTSNGHPLYARRLLASRVLWEGVGSQPMPSAFVVGTNQTHTSTPQTTTLSPGADVVAVGASAQKGLAPIVPVLGFTGGDDVPYGETPSTPKLARAASIDDAVILLKMAGLTPVQEQQIRPDTTKLAAWGVGQTTRAPLAELARLLLFTANTFRFGLVGTVIMPAMRDDPHGAFSGLPFSATADADTLARVLDGFYAELATANEVACGHRGVPLSLADNVVMLVSGDTPKDSFQRNGWPDGTVGNANIMYVRSNGWLEPGWFGKLVPGARTNFDPTTGSTSAGATVAQSTNAALGGLLYALTRGNEQLVAASSQHPYQGTVAPTKP